MIKERKNAPSRKSIKHFLDTRPENKEAANTHLIVKLRHLNIYIYIYKATPVRVFISLTQTILGHVRIIITFYYFLKIYLNYFLEFKFY
jgi:hypothetical protein